MKGQTLMYVPVLSFVLCAVFLTTVRSSPSNFFDNDDAPSEYNDFLDNDLERILYVAVKRSEDESTDDENCIARGGNCDNRATECCNYTSCRCNLWGANCRCQRRGIFQKWGK